ncbi:MAG TPA: anti-sigma factor antagonist [Propionibacteriaceae bacterium]|nr:anti-sigma factor antagonist [Propionibacteriaceae bacterium]
MEELQGPISVAVDASRPHALVLHVGGEVDISTAGAIRREWAEMISARRPEHDLAVIDLSGVVFFGSSGLAALVDCRQAADEQALTFRVVVAAPTVMRPFKGTGLIDCFDWYQTLEAAVAEESSEKPLPPIPAT